MKIGELTEIELLNELKLGNERALGLIFEQYWDKLLAYAINRLKDQEEAQEVVQDLFIKLWSIRDKLDIQVSLSVYLSKAITNRVYDRLDKLYRNSRKHRQMLLEAQEPLSAAADLLLFAKELQEEIDNAISTLPEKCRVVFRKSRIEGFSNAQIAQDLELSQRTVETHISNALRSLRSSLSTGSLVLVLMQSNLTMTNWGFLIHPFK